MSESSKMGLFGSKDDNTETTDEKKETVKPKETLQDRSAPYNIDSDSEAYDTEALSIMDINDIIGIQAESAGDSTLESEIAALSEVITDIKSDDITSGSSKSFDAKRSNTYRSDSNRDIGRTKDKGSEKDSSKEDICSQADANKSSDITGMAAINKSLQLIGEAYDSDDSQDADTDDLPSISIPKSDNPSETHEESKNKDAETAAENSSRVEAVGDDLVEPKQIIVDECSLELKKDAASDKPVETAKNPVEDDPKSMQIEKSADSTDSATDVSTKQSAEEYETESMDVDSPLTQDIEKSPCNNPEESKAIEKDAEKPMIELTAVNTENLPVTEAEEPMEVDQPNEEVSGGVETEKSVDISTGQGSHNIETGKTEDVSSETVSDNVETDKVDTVATETFSDNDENKKADTDTTEKVSDNFETEKTDAGVTAKVSDNFETEKVDIVATETDSNQVLTEKADVAATEDVAENNPSPSDLVVSEVAVKVTEMIIQSEQSTERKDEILNDPKYTPDLEIRKESSNDQVSKGETSNSETEEVIASKNVEKDLKQSINTAEGQKIAAEKLEMETEDSQVEESCTAKDKANSPDSKIVESVAAEQSHSTDEGNKLETWTQKTKVEEEISPEKLTRVTELHSHDSMLIERDKTVDNEPMEVDDNAEYHKTESDKKSINVSDLSDNYIDTVKPVADIVVPLKQSETVDFATDSHVISSDLKETAEIETVLSNKLKEGNKNETITNPSILSENSVEIGESTSDITPKETDKSKTIETSAELSKNFAGIDESIPNITLNECVQDEDSVASELIVNSAEIIQSVEAVTSKDNSGDNLIERQVETPAESEIIAEAMETEDITLENSSEKVLASELSEKSAVVVETFVDIIPRVLPIVAAEKIAVEDEKMEVDAGAKKDTQRDKESDICRPDITSPKPEESLLTAVQEGSAIKEKATIAEAKKSDKIEINDKIVENVPEISDVSAARASSEIEAIKSIDETDEAKQDSREEKNLSSFAIQKASTEKNLEIVVTEATDNVRAEIAQDENKVVGSELNKEENVPSIVIQEPESSKESESSTEKIHEIEARQIADNVMVEVTEDEKIEVISGSEKEKNVPSFVIQEPESSKESESSTEKIHEIEARQIEDNIMVEVKEDEKKEVKSGSEKEENVPSFVVEETESSTEKIHETQTTITAENIIAQVTEDENKEVKSESKKEENVPSIVIQEPETSTDKVEIQATESVSNVMEEVTEDEKREIKSDSEKEENVSSILIQKGETSTEKIQEIVAVNTSDNIVKEIPTEERTEIDLQSKQVEIAISSECSESLSQKSPGAEITKADDEPMDEESNNKTNLSKPEPEKAELSIPMDISEPSTDNIHADGATETPDEITVKKHDEATQLQSKENESVLSAVIEKTDTSTEINEVKTPETSAAIAEMNTECKINEPDTITTEVDKESIAPVEKLETSVVESETKITKASKEIIKALENENDKVEAESMKTSISEDEELNKTSEIPTKTNEKIMDEDLENEKEEKEISKSDDKEVEEESSVSTKVTTEIPETPDIENSKSSAEQSTSTTIKNDAESHFAFPKPETVNQESNQTDLLSSSLNLDDIEDEEDPVDEEMNLSLDPEITECQELNSRDDADEEVQQIGELSLEKMTVDPNEIDDQANIDQSLDSEKKSDEYTNVRDEPLNKLTVENSVGESSITRGIKKQEQSDERLEKPTEDDDENSKDVLSTMVHVPGIFHDEQSQNTQEMMDSILERDSSNFNKVLDDEEGVGAALACANNLPLEETEIDELTDKLPPESEEMLNKALDDPMSAQNIDSLEGLLDLDLIQEGDEATLKSVDPIVAKVMNEAEEDIETKDVDVSLLLEETDQCESVDRDEYVCATEESVTNEDVVPKIVEEEAEKIVTPAEKIFPQDTLNDGVNLPVKLQMETAASTSTENNAVFELPIVEPNVIEADEREPDAVETNQMSNEESKLELAEDLLREIAVDEERKMELPEDLLLETPLEKHDQTNVPENFLLESVVQKESHINLPAELLLQAEVQEENKMSLPGEVLLTAAVETVSGIDLVEEVMLEGPVSEVPKMELSEDNSMERVVRDQVLTVAAEIEDLPPNSEISELESAVKFLQESEEQGIDSPLVLSPKMVDSVVDEIARVEDVGIFVTDADICEDPSALVAELENIIPDPIAISEAEIISEAAKLESERKTKISEEAKLKSPIIATIEKPELTLKVIESTPPTTVSTEVSITTASHPETPKTHREPRETVAKSPKPEKNEQATLLKKSAPIPKISILEERLKEPPKIEIPSVGEVSRTCEMPTTPKTSLLIQRDAKLSSFQKMLESPKTSEKTEHKIVDTPRKDTDKHDFENVGSPRIILKIAKSAIADCGEPRSPKSPKIRSATNSPNPEDSPGQKLGKIKLKLSKGGHPSIISNENVEEICGQWHTEGTSSLSPLGMKIKFSKTGDASIVSTEKHEATEDTKEPPKHKFEEAKRTESPIGMKIKFSKTGDASIVQQDSKESSSKHKDKLDIMQESPKRNESPLGMKIKFSKSGDASIIQPEKSESSDDHREISTRGKDKLDVSHDVPRRTESPLGIKFKLFKTGDASIVASEIAEDSPPETKRNDSPLGMKIKLSKTRGSASIVPAESSDDVKERLDLPEVPRRTESPLGMKIKLSKSGDASIIHLDDTKDTAKHKERAESSQESLQAPVSVKSEAVKIKVTKSKNTSEIAGEVENVQVVPKRAESSIGMKFKLSKTGDASIVHSEKQEHVSTSSELRSKERTENLQETSRKSDAAIGMKIKFSKTGDASIIQPQLAKKSTEPTEIEAEQQKSSDIAIPMKIKLQKSGDASIVDTDKKDKSLKRKETDSPLEMKIKLSKTGHPTIIACDNYGETSQRTKDIAESHKHKESISLREMPGMKMLKSIQPGITGNRAELTIEPVQMQSRKSDSTNEPSPKRKDVTISPIESKKAKLEAKLSQMLPEVTIQPIKPREQKPIMFDSKASSISRQQMNVISQEISITQVRSNKAIDLSMTNKPKSLLAKNATTSAIPDCEIIEHRPELIIVNENSNSSQDVMIIEEVPAMRGPEAKVPKKRGRPRRNPLPLVPTKPIQQAMTDATIPKDPLALDDIPQVLPKMTSQISPKMIPLSLPPKENERPKRSCSRQKSYAPPRRGRGRGGGRGKRKMEMEHMELSKKPRIDQDLTLIEQSTTALITIDEGPAEPEISHSTSELYKALRQPPMDHKMANAMARVEAEQAVNEADLLAKNTRESQMDSRIKSHLDSVIGNSMNKPAEPEISMKKPVEPEISTNKSTEPEISMNKPAEPEISMNKSVNPEISMNKSADSKIFETERKMSLESLCSSKGQKSAHLVADEIEKPEIIIVDEKTIEKTADDAKDNKDTVNVQDQENWLTPSSIKLLDGRTEGNISNVQVMDEETRMSAESSSRSQTPARNLSLQAPETIVNEESQGSVLSTATTESEKVKVKNRRMEINFDPDEGPFTVDKVAEYEWPLDPTRKSETFMIQEQISHYLGVKSFKRKYPDLKRRMVDMEERNYLRENALVSEAMCDMGLTAVCSSEVLDIMCNDFPDQYEEYRKYIRERQMKEHSKKQKELTAAANAEKNRIDLAEMAVQSALSWNVGLNKARRESRKCSLDLQTFTIHVPKKQQKVEEESRQSHYPVALIPGQYTDYYREYTPAELRYYPLNTVLYGPMKPNERKLDSQSEGSQSDSDSDSSSDDSSSSSSDGTQDTEESQSTMDEVDVELSRQKEDIKNIKCKMCLKHLNKFSRIEVLIQCGTCNGYVHPSCIDLTLDMVPHIQAYAWQCTDCKTCAQCHDPADEDKMLFCDMCDRGYHIYCVGLRRVPQGRWHCQECAVCASCGSREAGGANSDRNSVAQWQHEYKKGDKNTRVYVSTLCVPCSKLWRKGRYCPHCSRCHTVPQLDLEANLVHCSACDKYLHLGCVETKDLTIDRKNYLCDVCQPSRQQMVKPLVSKVFRT